MRRFSHWAFALGSCTLLLAQIGWTAVGTHAPKPDLKPDTQRLKSSSDEQRPKKPTGPDPAKPPAKPAKPDTLKSELDSGELGPEIPQSAYAAPSTGSGAGLRAAEWLPARTMPDEQALREILQIRREQGGLFHGTLFEDLASPAAEEEFLEALRNAAASHAKAMAAHATTSACDASCARQFRQRPARSPSDLELIQTLRLAGRQLDGKAADLEDSQQYEEADRLRSLARKLRKQARGLAGSPHSAR